MSVLWEVVEPHLARIGAYTVPDPTYGRYTLPPYPPHKVLIDDPNVKHQYRRVILRPYSDFPTLAEAYRSSDIVQSHEVQLTQDEIAAGVALGGRWVTYSVWEMEEPEGGWEGKGLGVGRDVVLIHGLSDYGLRYTPHVKYFLRAGFRVIIPDLPSYGRSTGVHSYLPSLDLLPAAVHAVLTDVVRVDLAVGKDQRKLFLCGSSMGGWTVLYYLLKYPPNPSANSVAQAQGPEDAKPRIQVAGAFVLCPMVKVSKESRPYPITELVGRGIKYLAGTLPLAKALKGKVSDDPRVEEDFNADAICYHGWVRVATGFALLAGMTELDERAEEIDVPIRLVHGSSDRVTSYEATLKLFDRLPNQDKEIEIYEGYEHVMLKVGRDAADDEKRQRVLADWRGWMLKRC